MTKILICDDEGIVRESLEFILSRQFKNEVSVYLAKNGRMAIELADLERPDIIIMDIQMPGINGIEAMREIRKDNRNIMFIVLTAYDKFEYSKASIDVGVFAYLMKPVNRDKFCEIIQQAITKTKERKEKISTDLRTRERLEAVVPIIEHGFIYSMLFETHQDNADKLGYRELLGICEEYGYVLLLACGDELQKGVLTNPVGAGIKLKNSIQTFREVVQDGLPAIIGEVMANQVIVVIPCEKEDESYEARVVKIESIRTLIRRLEKKLSLHFKASIGKSYSWLTIGESYQEARDAFRKSVGKVTHAGDVSSGCMYEESYPIELENKLFLAIKQGDVKDSANKAKEYMDWLMEYSPNLNNTTRLKTMEFVLWAEHIAYSQGGKIYRISDREDYLDTLLAFSNYEEMTLWFIEKIRDATAWIAHKTMEKEDNIIEEAKFYIKEKFHQELSLEALARHLGISPYYFSKLFKEVEGVNYIDFLTSVRMDYAKESLREREKSIKEICMESGYSDPNYFSRLFKKWTGKTPTEYREKGVFQ